MSKKRKPPASPSAQRSADRAIGTRGKKAAKPYHHGDLRAALIAAAEAIITERGVDGFTLREAARRAGVSPAAPAHHFGDAAGLLSALAKLGFKDFGDALRAADHAGGDDPVERLKRQGIAYVTFAIENPARFHLMFRSDKLDAAYQDLQAVGQQAFRILENAIRDLCALSENQPMTPGAYGALMATWSMVHGFAHLALGGEFDDAASRFGGGPAIVERFLPMTLRYLPRPEMGR
jgi:AcrR family transcriptional regulator